MKQIQGEFWGGGKGVRSNPTHAFRGEKCGKLENNFPSTYAGRTRMPIHKVTHTHTHTHSHTHSKLQHHHNQVCCFCLAADPRDIAAECGWFLGGLREEKYVCRNVRKLSLCTHTLRAGHVNAFSGTSCKVGGGGSGVPEDSISLRTTRVGSLPHPP